MSTDAEDYRGLLLGFTWTFTSLSSVFVGLRYFCRFYCHQKFGWDDFWIVVSLFFSFAMSITWTVYANLGGTINAPLPYSQSTHFGLASWISQTWCITAIVTTKLAVAALIMRLQGPSKFRTRALWILCTIAAAWGIIQIGFVWGQCHPVSTLWDPEGNPDGECWSPYVVVYNGIACSSYWALVDIALALIPVHMVWKLQIALGRKIAICILLSTGLFAAAIAIVRTSKLTADLQKTSETVYNFVMFFVWNSLEINTLIISACIPTLMPLFELARGRQPSGKKRNGYGSIKASHPHNSHPASYALRKTARPAYPGGDFTDSQEHIAHSVDVSGKLDSQDDDAGFVSRVDAARGTESLQGGIHVKRDVNVTTSERSGH